MPGIRNTSDLNALRNQKDILFNSIKYVCNEHLEEIFRSSGCTRCVCYEFIQPRHVTIDSSDKIVSSILLNENTNGYSDSTTFFTDLGIEPEDLFKNAQVFTSISSTGLSVNNMLLTDEAIMHFKCSNIDTRSFIGDYQHMSPIMAIYVDPTTHLELSSLNGIAAVTECTESDKKMYVFLGVEHFHSIGHKNEPLPLHISITNYILQLISNICALHQLPNSEFSHFEHVLIAIECNSCDVSVMINEMEKNLMFENSFNIPKNLNILIMMRENPAYKRAKTPNIPMLKPGFVIGKQKHLICQTFFDYFNMKHISCSKYITSVNLNPELRGESLINYTLNQLKNMRNYDKNRSSFSGKLTQGVADDLSIACIFAIHILRIFNSNNGHWKRMTKCTDTIDQT